MRPTVYRLCYILLSLLLPLPMQAPLIIMSIFCRFGYELGQRRNNLSRLLWSKLSVILKLRRGILCTAINKSHVAMRVANKQLETYLHIARHGPAPTIDFQAVICVINRLLNGHCFLEHRCHDILRKTNSTFLSVDRSPRQLSKAKKSGSSLFIFFFFLKRTYVSLGGFGRFARPYQQFSLWETGWFFHRK